MKKIINMDGLLATGQVAKIKLYRDLLELIGRGEVLKSSELKVLRELELEFQAGKEKNPDSIPTLSKAAAYCGVSTRSIKYNLGRGNIRQYPDGSFRREVLDKWLRERGRRLSNRENLNSELIKQAELRFRRARAKREELIVAQLQGRLIPLEEVERAFTGRAYELARSLLMLSRRISHRVVAKNKRKMKAIKGILDKEMHILMEQYSRPIEMEP